MHWEILIIPLIALGVWILGTLFKGGEDERLKRGARRPGDLSGRTPPRRPVTDLDRFLEEARQRREAEERRQAPPPPPIRTAIARSPLRERPSQSREAPATRPAPTAIRKPEVPVAIPVARPVSKPPVAEPILLESADEAAPPPSTPPTTRVARPSPIVQQVRSLLSKPQTAGTAFVLREIFSPPLCRRHR
ncbi:MAG TPA: hypothetical protein VH643_38335 [Gemmataceae bacterium]|jgi:hypothetical protein